MNKSTRIEIELDAEEVFAALADRGDLPLILNGDRRFHDDLTIVLGSQGYDGEIELPERVYLIVVTER